MNEWLIIISSLFVITIFLTILDLYPQIHSFYIFVTPSYYILLIILFVCNSVAAYALKKQIFKNGDMVALLAVSSLCTFSIIQSFVLEFGNHRLINLSDWINKLKVAVLKDARQIGSKRDMLKTQTTAKRLSSKYGTSTLEEELESLLSQKHGQDQTGKMIEKIKNYANQKGLNLGRLLANRIAQVDLDRAEQLAKDC
jgi:hypothetical protein